LESSWGAIPGGFDSHAHRMTTIYGVYDFGDLVGLYFHLESAQAKRDEIRADCEEEYWAGITVEPVTVQD